MLNAPYYIQEILEEERHNYEPAEAERTVFSIVSAMNGINGNFYRRRVSERTIDKTE